MMNRKRSIQLNFPRELPPYQANFCGASPVVLGNTRGKGFFVVVSCPRHRWKKWKLMETLRMFLEFSGPSRKLSQRPYKSLSPTLLPSPLHSKHKPNQHHYKRFLTPIDLSTKTTTSHELFFSLRLHLFS